MDYYQIINYIVLALIIILIIHLVFQAIKRRKNSSESFSQERPAPVIEEPEDEQDIAKEMQRVIEEKPQMKCKHAADYYLGIEPNNGCTICKTDSLVDDYIRESLLHNAQICKPPKQYTPEDYDKYRDDFYSFRNKIERPSHNDDLVDRITEMYLSGNTDIARNHKGVMIKDLYDNLTKQDANLYTTQCKRMPEVGGITHEGEHKAAGFRGDYFTKDNWTYDKENTINGGEFFGGVYPNDSDAQYERAL